MEHKLKQSNLSAFFIKRDRNHSHNKFNSHLRKKVTISFGNGAVNKVVANEVRPSASTVARRLTPPRLSRVFAAVSPAGTLAYLV